MNRFLVIVICFSLTLLFWGGIFYPKYQKARIIWEEIGVKRSELKHQEEYFSDLEKTSQKLKEKEYEESLSKIESAFPFSPDFPSLFRFLERSSFENGLILKEINPSFSAEPGVKTRIKENRLAISVSGSYSAFKNFLYVLQKSSRMIEVTSIAFSEPKEGETYSFNLEIKVHSY